MNFRPLLLLLSCLTAPAEVLTLTDSERFEGKLLGIDPEDGILLASPRSPEAVAFRASSLQRLELTPPPAQAREQSERLVLANGDILPGKLLSLDEHNLRYRLPGENDLSIPRDRVATLRFGIRPQQLLYRGPGPLDEWMGSGVEDWSLGKEEEDGLLILEAGEISRLLDLGPQFILKFSLRWQEEPSLRISFANYPNEQEQRDGYYLALNSGGVQVRRESNEGPHTRTLLALDNVEAFDDNAVTVEIRVNRLLNTLDLYLDDTLIRQMRDEAPPTHGQGLSIARNRTNSGACYLSELEVYSWDAVSQMELFEEPPAAGQDSLIDADGRRLSGQLLTLRGPTPPAAEEEPRTPEEETPAGESGGEESRPSDDAPAPTGENSPAAFLLASPFVDEPVAIPEQETRIIYFRRAEENPAPATDKQYLIEIANEGLLTTGSFSLDENGFTLSHPLLGPLTLPTGLVREIRSLPEPTTP
ncbi:hypothetical protein [Roseibacillus ishigakijimensis]|nr:hypothetical protein [Roseibacillus ishigakijimensis]